MIYADYFLWRVRFRTPCRPAFRHPLLLHLRLFALIPRKNSSKHGLGQAALTVVDKLTKGDKEHSGKQLLYVPDTSDKSVKATKHRKRFEEVCSLVERLVIGSREYISPYGTPPVEAIHSLRLMFTDKRITYPGSFSGRCFLTIGHSFLGQRLITELFD